MSLLGRVELDAATLWRMYPPRLHHPNKRLVLDLAGGLARTPRGELVVARYGMPDLPPLPEDAPRATHEDGFFSYAPSPDAAHVWHVNFANQYLFCAYGAAAFAQDEIQVAEHPVLGSVLEALTAERRDGLPPLTREGGRPTPVLIKGAERWCAIDTEPELAFPYGIYGRRFATAKAEALRQAVTRIDQAPLTNLIAMEAPQGAGRYTAGQIADIVVTASAGFTAARAESRGARVIVHTGHWGTGAYGGNPVLMATAQLLAARFAGLDAIVYHSNSDAGREAFELGRRYAGSLSASGASLTNVVGAIEELGLSWGTSDGN
jgi:hypothetical protein